MTTSFLASLYGRTFALFLLILTLFYTFFDFLFSSTTFISANVALLYIAYTALATLKLSLPLSLILAALFVLLRLVSSQELCALYSLGLSKKSLLKPFFLVASLASLSYWGIQLTPLAYAYENASELKKNTILDRRTTNLLIKYNHNFVYIGSLSQVTKTATDLRIFEFSEGKLHRLTYAKEAQYANNGWNLSDVRRLTLPPQPTLGGKGYTEEKIVSLHTLENFRPKILDIIAQSRRYLSLVDAIETLWLFQGQDVVLNRVYASLYLTITTPLYFFGPFLILIALIPVTPRMGNIRQFAAKSVLIILGSWGAIFALQNMASSGVILPSLAILFPFFLLTGISILIFKRYP